MDTRTPSRRFIGIALIPDVSGALRSSTHGIPWSVTAVRNACWAGTSSSWRQRATGIGPVVPWALAGEVLVGLQAAEHPQHVRPRPLVARGRGPTLVVAAHAAHRERAVDRGAATRLPADRVVQRHAGHEGGVDAPLGERPRELHLVGEPVGVRDLGMVGPCLDQQHLPGLVFAEPRRERGARGAAPHDDVVVLGHVTPAFDDALRRMGATELRDRTEASTGDHGLVRDSRS